MELLGSVLSIARYSRLLRFYYRLGLSQAFTKTQDDFFLAEEKQFLGCSLHSFRRISARWNCGNGWKHFQIWMYVAHFYWIGAIPAMIFLGLYMMPLLQRRIHSVPGYLKLRFDEKTRS